MKYIERILFTTIILIQLTSCGIEKNIVPQNEGEWYIKKGVIKDDKTLKFKQSLNSLQYFNNSIISDLSLSLTFDLNNFKAINPKGEATFIPSDSIDVSNIFSNKDCFLLTCNGVITSTSTPVFMCSNECFLFLLNL